MNPSSESGGGPLGCLSCLFPDPSIPQTRTSPSTKLRRITQIRVGTQRNRSHARPFLVRTDTPLEMFRPRLTGLISVLRTQDKAARTSPIWEATSHPTQRETEREQRQRKRNRDRRKFLHPITRSETSFIPNHVQRATSINILSHKAHNSAHVSSDQMRRAPTYTSVAKPLPATEEERGRT